MLIHGLAQAELLKIPQDSISLVITDPPYNYEFVGKDWDQEEIERRLEKVKNSSTMVKNLPYGSGLAGGKRDSKWYARNRKNILDYREWCLEWSKKLFRICKSGCYVLVFNSTRTIAHVQVALEDTGFYARDVLVYRRNSGIPKGLNIEKKLESLGLDGKQWEGWYSCLRNEWEGIVLVQKPLINNYVETLAENQIGLINTKSELVFKSNILEGFRKTEEERKLHINIKPLTLIEYLVSMFLPLNSGKIILDPFCGSGTTLLAAKNLGHEYIGIDKEQFCIEICKDRLK